MTGLDHDSARPEKHPARCAVRAVRGERGDVSVHNVRRVTLTRTSFSFSFSRQEIIFSSSFSFSQESFFPRSVLRDRD